MVWEKKNNIGPTLIESQMSPSFYIKACVEMQLTDLSRYENSKKPARSRLFIFGLDLLPRTDNVIKCRE